MNRATRNAARLHPPARKSQTGAALFIGLVMLVVIAIIGVSGVRSVVMEKNMATNSEYHMMVFQAAETAIEGTLADNSAFVDAINTPTSGTWPTRSYSMTHGYTAQSVTSSATIAVGTPTVPIGYSIGQFVTYPFTITGDGAIASINARTPIQTASKIAPYLTP
ncbi:MAG: PilX N-terminal domain-containing pilus assembly protein [Pseudomonadota bacterium]